MIASLRFVRLRTAHGPAPRLPISLLLAASLAILATLSFSPAARAAAIDDSVPSADVLAQLEQRASQASPREQPFLYTELVQSMTAKAGKELSDGDTTAADATLRQISHYAHLIQTSLARDTKQLKNAEMLMQHSTYRAPPSACTSPPPTTSGQVQATLAESRSPRPTTLLLTQVFQHSNPRQSRCVLVPHSAL